MLAIGIRFPAGHYHATPWGRHVNEAAVEWPPGGWRLLRALIALWHRLPPDERPPESRLDALITALASAPPAYHLPPAVLAHTRHYQPVRQGRAEKRVLVFDACARIDPQAPLVVAWPDLSPEPGLLACLDPLLERLNYLGRSESWAMAARLPDWTGAFNCRPDDSSDHDTDAHGESIDLLMPHTADEYAAWRASFLSAQALSSQPRARRRQLEATVPARLPDALRTETPALRKAGWSLPPGARWLRYRRPAEALRTSIQTAPVRPARAERPTTACLQLLGKPLPRIEDTIRIAERVRSVVMGIGGERTPPVLSGHGLPEGRCHAHAFFLPEDSDGDGHIDHLLIHAALGLDEEACRILDQLRQLRGRDGQTWRLLLEWIASPGQIRQPQGLLAQGQTFISTTPYLCPWHIKKHLGPAEQIRRECLLRGVPEPAEITALDSIELRRPGQPSGPRRRPVHFQRFRRRSGLMQPDTQGSFWRLSFTQPVQGPLALGWGCHFGLGLFRAEKWPGHSENRP